MGKLQNLTQKQSLLLDEIKTHPFFQGFYFTGGTALASAYLQHRHSDDLDFFNPGKFDHQVIFTLLSGWGEKHHFAFKSQFAEVVYIFMLTFSDQTEVKVDFAYYPYRRLEPGRLMDGVEVDSQFDIAVNKLLTVTQRTEVKDFVDLFFLLKEFSLWDLIEGVRRKFRVELDPILLGADLLKVDEFEFLPRMIKLVTLADMREFFQKQAKAVGAKSVS